MWINKLMIIIKETMFTKHVIINNNIKGNVDFQKKP
jgi:hypothetical protein